MVLILVCFLRDMYLCISPIILLEVVPENRRMSRLYASIVGPEFVGYRGSRGS